MNGPPYARGTSDLLQWPWILWAIESSPWPHERILDVGAGYGKASILLREYLNVKPERIDALEPSKDLHNDLVVVIAAAGSLFGVTAQEFDDWADYDTVLMADVIEHIPVGDVLLLLDRIPGQVIISTPVEPGVAEHARLADEIPELERHVSVWTPGDFGRRLHQHWVQSGQFVMRLRPLATMTGRG